jgi:hypothetical protein
MLFCKEYPIVRKTLLSMLAVAALLGASAPVAAQEAKNLLVVSFSGYDKMSGDIDFFMKLVGNPQVSAGWEGVKMMATMQGLGGIDPAKPWGAIVQTQGDQFPITGFIPVKDFAKMKETLTSMQVEMKDVGDGVSQISAPGRAVFLKEKGGWVFIGPSPEGLKTTPADPTALLGEMPKRHNVSVRATVKNVPDEFRKMFLAELQKGAAAATQQNPGESDEEYAIRSGVTKRMIQSMVAAVNELDELLVGWGVDRTKGCTYIDFDITAIPGTKLAANFTSMANATTNLAGFNLPGAAATLSAAGTMSDEEVADTKKMIVTFRDKIVKDLKAEGLDGNELQQATQIIDDLFAVVQKTIEGKKSDIGAVLMLSPDAATLAFGSVLADGAKLEKAVKQAVAMAGKDEPGVLQIVKFDAETYQGVRFHTLSIPAPNMPPEAVKFLGNPVEGVLGVSDTNAYFAIGKDAVKTLKQIIDKSKADAGKAIAPGQLTISATPIAKFAQAAAPPPVQAGMGIVVQALEQAAGKDKLTITVKAIPNGASGRLEIEEGIIKVLPLLAPAAAAPGAPPPAGGPFGE